MSEVTSTFTCTTRSSAIVSSIAANVVARVHEAYDFHDRIGVAQTMNGRVRKHKMGVAQTRYRVKATSKLKKYGKFGKSRVRLLQGNR